MKNSIELIIKMNEKFERKITEKLHMLLFNLKCLSVFFNVLATLFDHLMIF